MHFVKENQDYFLWVLCVLNFGPYFHYWASQDGSTALCCRLLGWPQLTQRYVLISNLRLRITHHDCIATTLLPWLCLVLTTCYRL